MPKEKKVCLVFTRYHEHVGFKFATASARVASSWVRRYNATPPLDGPLADWVELPLLAVGPPILLGEQHKAGPSWFRGRARKGPKRP